MRHILAGEPLAGFSTVVFLFVHARLVNQHLARTAPPSPSRSSRPMAGACVCGRWQRKFNFVAMEAVEWDPYVGHTVTALP